MSKRLLLFVHGLGGNGTDAWGEFPKLIRDDPDLSGMDIAHYEYPTMFVRWPWEPRSVRIQDLAKSIRTEIDVRYHQYSEILLVCHSMGGVICKKYLIDEMKKTQSTRVRGIALFAVPTSGAELARWGSLISWRHWQLKQLRHGSDLLDSVREDWERLVPDAGFEVRVVAGGQDAIIQNPEGNDKSLNFVSDRGHVDLIKPATRSDLPYLILRDLVVKVFKLNGATTIDPGSSSPVFRPSSLFDLFRPEFEPFYCERRVDRLVLGYLSMQNIWLFGRSGYGKTSALLRALHLSGNKFRLVSLGHHLGTDAQGVFRALLSALTEDQAVNDGSNLRDWPELIEALVLALERIADSGTKWVLVEEMPLNTSDELRSYFSRFCSALVLYSRRHSAKPISFAFSSVRDPRIGYGDMHRMAELLKVINFPRWAAGDLTRLVETILADTHADLTAVQLSKLARASRGSPRFVKLFFGNYLNLCRVAGVRNQFDAALKATELELPDD